MLRLLVALEDIYSSLVSVCDPESCVGGLVLFVVMYIIRIDQKAYICIYLKV